MGISDEMKALTEDIMVSHDMRVKTIGELVENTQGMLKGFEADRKTMGKEQAKNLADFVNGLEKNVSDMINGFQKSRKEMSDEQAKALSDFVNNLTKDVGDMMKDIQKVHKEMADNLKESLEKGEADRLKEFKDMMGNIQKDVKDIETYVANKLKEFSDAHAEMSEELKKDLAKYVAGIVSESRNLLKDYKTEREKMAANWQSMAVAMAKKRGGKPGEEVKAVEEVKEEAMPPAGSIEEQVLWFIERHPNGVKVSDMEETLGVPRMKLGIIAKGILEEGKVKKEDNLYFPL